MPGGDLIQPPFCKGAIKDESIAFTPMNLLHLDLPLVAPVEYNTSCSSHDSHIPQVAERERGTTAERLQDLEDEWTIEGLFEKGAAAVGMTTLALGMMVDGRWLLLPLILSALLLQQTLQGWCPLLPLLRWLGFRTEREIDQERHTLQQMDEERTTWQHPVWVRTESPSLPSPELPHTNFSLQGFLLGTAR